ncbi:hypothetical protein VNO78_32368 [Psophocarpus tetragonolobus]|uniref:Uncharacterized protein n=1 Tax=Psophocarpus tetragonolobus TaxID=3891 RepID=A0AAN9NVC9_PSOTE
MARSRIKGNCVALAAPSALRLPPSPPSLMIYILPFLLPNTLSSTHANFNASAHDIHAFKPEDVYVEDGELEMREKSAVGGGAAVIEEVNSRKEKGVSSKSQRL